MTDRRQQARAFCRILIFFGDSRLYRGEGHLDPRDYALGIQEVDQVTEVVIVLGDACAFSLRTGRGRGLQGRLLAGECLGLPHHDVRAELLLADLQCGS